MIKYGIALVIAAILGVAGKIATQTSNVPVSMTGSVTVNSRVDAPDVNPGDGICASERNGCTVRAAIEEANWSKGPNQIIIPAGKYFFTQGELLIIDTITISGAGADETTLDARRRSRVIRVATGAIALFENFSVENGLVARQADGAGAGIYNQGTLLLRGIKADGNVGFYGGAIYNEGTLEIRDVTIRRNRVHADGAGGGIYNTGAITADGLTFWYNRTRLNEDEGGGGAFFNSGSATMQNCTIIRNRARRSRAGAIVNEGYLKLTNCTIWHNQARYNTAGLVNNGVAELANTIIAGNERIVARPSIKGGNCYGNLPISLGHNLESGTLCGFSGPGDISGADLRLKSVDYDGGPTETAALRVGSPAIDAADNALCPQDDQRRTARPIDGNGDGVAVCDIGAYEFTN